MNRMPSSSRVAWFGYSPNYMHSFVLRISEKVHGHFDYKKIDKKN